MVALDGVLVLLVIKIFLPD